jgi:dienelactone hydrolase
VPLPAPAVPEASSSCDGTFIDVTPNPAFVDEEVGIVLRGAPAGRRIAIRVSSRDDEGRLWGSRAEYVSDATGIVDTHSHASRRGDYRGLSPMGLFWSMCPQDDDEKGRGLFVKKDERESLVEISATVDGRETIGRTLVRQFAAPGTVVRDLSGSENGEGKVGRLFIPPGRTPHPAVIVLGGSGGGFDLDKAAILSRHGFATLALAYFGVPPLPNWLHRIPLEYFESAIAWLSAQPEIDAHRIAILGVSRGAELALLLASSMAQISSVVAYAPSHVAWAAGGRDKSTREQIPVWMRGGRPVPFASLPLRGFMLRSAIPVVGLRRPVVFRNLFRAGLRHAGEIAKAAIPAEKIAGPILLVSGGDDRVWPAAEMSEQIISRLKRNKFAHAAEHLHYPRAGHMLRYPFLPTTPRHSRHAHLRNAKFAYGGTAEADAQADFDAWRHAIRFLRRALSA